MPLSLPGPEGCCSGSLGGALLLERGPQFGTASLQVRPEAWVLAPEAAAGVALAAAALLGGLAGDPFAGALERTLEALRLRPVADRAVGDPERRGGRDLGLAAGQHRGGSGSPLAAQTPPLGGAGHLRRMRTFASTRGGLARLVRRPRRGCDLLPGVRRT
jgi:hypothetical protein